MIITQFSITFLQNYYEENGKILQYGKIQLGDFEETFLSHLCFWSVEDYCRHWKKALERIIIDDLDFSALITDIHSPMTNDVIQWWPFYKIGNEVCFQNNLLFLSNINDKFDANNPFKYISKRKIYTDEEEQISEWVIPISLLEDFYCQMIK